MQGYRRTNSTVMTLLYAYTRNTGIESYLADAVIATLHFEVYEEYE